MCKLEKLFTDSKCSKFRGNKILQGLLATNAASVAQELPFNCKLLVSAKQLCGWLPLFFLCVRCWPTTGQEVGEEPWRANGKDNDTGKQESFLNR